MNRRFVIPGKRGVGDIDPDISRAPFLCVRACSKCLEKDIGKQKKVIFGRSKEK
jgi:hypothetical protein